MTIDARAAVGTQDVVLITLDTLRFDVADQAMREGRTPVLGSLLPGGVWERRHSPGSFTYSAHHAFFAGFLPTPPAPGPHPRLFAARFPGAESVDGRTFEFDAAALPAGLAQHGYHTICVGGVGFFNRLSPLGSVLPDLFDESHWREEFGVTSATSTAAQVRCAMARVAAQPSSRRLFLFVNVSALHQPNCLFGESASDSPQTQAEALGYVDAQLGPLIHSLRQRAPLLFVVCSDHGTAYGEAGHRGHRLAHQVVWDVPYGEAILSQIEG